MNRYCLSILLQLIACAAWAQESVTPVQVSGQVHAQVSTMLNTDQDQMEWVYSTNDPRLGTNSGNRYFSDINDVSQNVHAVYGADVQIDMNASHSLHLSLEGANDNEHAMGSRLEQLRDPSGNLISSACGQYNHPNELSNELSVAVDYTCRLRRPGSSISLGYRYRWENENAGVEQHINEATAWSLYQTNVLEQQINYHYHHAHLDYTLPVAKGHLLDFGLAYDRRALSVRSEQEWDGVCVLNADYQHLTQYGGAHARYRLKLGPLEAMARLEYRATRMQERWLHDVLPTATIRYHIDSIHSLSAFYTIVLIHPEVQHLDTTRISDTYSQRFGNNDIIGIHLHNVALTYRAHLPKVDCSAEVRYLTTTDGFNAMWMERGGRLLYTWGNEGVRHAVGFTPAVDAHLSSTTDLHTSATVMWDKRVAAAINLANANWGVRADVRLTQQILGMATAEAANARTAMFLVARGDYAYHNTLDVYSYAGHGGSVGADLKLNIPTSAREASLSAARPLSLSVGYTCLFKPDVHILQGAYVGTIAYRPGATHIASVRLAYTF